MNNINLIEAKNLTLRYGKKTALNDVSIAVPKGRVVGLLGHNGAGKTTLMKAMVGLAQAQGQPQMFGERCQHPRKKKYLLYICKN